MIGPMATLVDLLDPTPGPLWTLVSQAGITDVVSILDGAEQQSRWLSSQGSQSAVPPPLAGTSAEDAPWSYPRLAQLQEQFAGHGLRLVGIEDSPPLDLVRLGLAGRDAQIDQLLTQIRAMGRLEIPVLCYNWSALTSWSRTDVAVPLRGGALSTGFAMDEMRLADPLPGSEEYSQEQLWDGLEYFLSAVVPVAEESGVALAMHPDDPPVAEIRGVPRIMNSLDSFRRLLDSHASASNGMTLCQGNFALITPDLPSMIREFGTANRIKFVHFRDVSGTPEHFYETFHDDGPTDMYACMLAYEEVGFDGPMRPDHVPTLAGETNARPGYETLGRLLAFGYITGLREAARRDRHG